VSTAQTYEGFGAFEGGVNADKGAPLVSTSSDGETALLFGPAALREIQAGVANGDFAIPPDAAGDTITAENPLPYWTFTDVNSAGAITAAIIADAGAGSGNVLRFTIASGTLTGKSATLTRYIPARIVRLSLVRFLRRGNLRERHRKYAGDGHSDLPVLQGRPSHHHRIIVRLWCVHLQQPSQFHWHHCSEHLGCRARPDTCNRTCGCWLSRGSRSPVATVATQSAARTVDLTEVRVVHGVPGVDHHRQGRPCHLSHQRLSTPT